MDNVINIFAEHGLLTVFIAVFAEQLGAPFPALPFLLLAGAEAANDSIFGAKALALASVASMLADSLWFLAGRRYGRRVLSLLCRISISPDLCVQQSERSFAQRGIAALVVAKFVPGLSTLTPPLAGAMGMSTRTFLLFNLAGTALWAGAGIVAGLVFHRQMNYIVDWLNNMGGIASAVLVGILGSYVAWRAWRRWRFSVAGKRFTRIKPDELATRINQNADVVIVDVRNTGIPLLPEGKLPGARHVDLRAIESMSLTDWRKDVPVITYCACPGDASAVEAARRLADRGFHVSVLQGGIIAWVDAGYGLEQLSTG